MKFLLLLVPALVIAGPSAHYKPYQDAAARQAPVVQPVTLYPPRPTTGAPQSQLRALCGSPRGRFPHPLDCRKYLDCWDGRVLEVQCPNDLAYSDLSGGFCDYLEYVDCGSRPVKPLPEEVKAATSAPAVPPSTNMSTVVSSLPVPVTPPKDFSFINGKYYFFSTGPTDWNTARSLCRLNGPGSDLVSINSLNEYNSIAMRIDELETIRPAPSVYKTTNYYIGLNDQQTEGNWVWSNGNKAATYTKWLANQPDGARTENCAALATDELIIGWFDVGCSQQLRYICEWDPTVLGGVTPSPQPDNLVPPGFMKFGNGGRYLISTVPAMNFQLAAAYCSNQGFGSDLVALETESEYLLMKSALNLYGVGSYYTGLNDLVTEGTFTWGVGNPPATFTDGLTNMGGDMDCVIMDQSSGFNYVNVPCWLPYHFICEWTPQATKRQRIDLPATRNVTDLSERHEMRFPAPQQIVRRQKPNRRQ